MRTLLLLLWLLLLTGCRRNNIRVIYETNDSNSFIKTFLNGQIVDSRRVYPSMVADLDDNFLDLRVHRGDSLLFVHNDSDTSGLEVKEMGDWGRLRAIRVVRSLTTYRKGMVTDNSTLDKDSIIRRDFFVIAH